MISRHENFTRNLVKGKIAETIFAQMFREADRYTVLEFGYEKIIPELVRDGYRENSEIIDTLRTAPDFAVIDDDEHHVKLVEVKYRAIYDNLKIREIAETMHRLWNPSWLFVCSLDKFYFDKVNKIIENNGHMAALSDEMIPNDLQLRYLEILRDFEDGK